MARYSDINRAAELKDAYDKLKLWQAKTRAEKETAYAAVRKPVADRVKTERQEAYIFPFNNDSTVIMYEAQVIHTTQTGAGNATANDIRLLVDDYFSLDVPTGKESIRVPKYQFAKIIGSKRTTSATTTSNSRLTNLPYKRHRSDNVSCPFGRKSSALTETYGDVVKAIKALAGYDTFNDVAGNRIGFVAEG